MHVLAHVGETDDEPCILAVRQPLAARDSGVLLEQAEHLAPRGRAFRPLRPVERGQHVRAEFVIGLLTQARDRVGDVQRVNRAHGGKSVETVIPPPRPHQGRSLDLHAHQRPVNGENVFFT